MTRWSLRAWSNSLTRDSVAGTRSAAAARGRGGRRKCASDLKIYHDIPLCWSWCISTDSGPAAGRVSAVTGRDNAVTRYKAYRKCYPKSVWNRCALPEFGLKNLKCWWICAPNYNGATIHLDTRSRFLPGIYQVHTRYIAFRGIYLVYTWYIQVYTRYINVNLKSQLSSVQMIQDIT